MIFSSPVLVASILSASLTQQSGVPLTLLTPRIEWVILSSFLQISPDSFVLLVRRLSLCRHVLISPLVMCMYKQHIPEEETGEQRRIWTQLCSWKVRGREKGRESKKERENKTERIRKRLEDLLQKRSGLDKVGGRVGVTDGVVKRSEV